MQAKASFTITSWDEETCDESDGIKRLRATVVKGWEGDVEGTSSAELLMVHTADGPSAYTAQERFTGTLDGRSGTFLTQHGAVEATQPPWVIITGSGTGELAGIRGTGTLTMTADGAHEFTLDFELDEPV